MTNKLMILGRRKANLSHDECVEYLHEEHAPLIKQLPGLRRFTTAIPREPDDCGYDEVAQLWFETPEDLEAAVDSEAWQRIRQDAENFVDMDSLVTMAVTDERLQYHAIPERV